MTIVETRETDEPNGVEIVIPVRRYNNIEQKARNFYRFWDSEKVLINDEKPTPIDGLKVSDTMTIIPDDYTDYVVMGNVPYPANIDTGLRKGRLVAYVSIGDVNFTPSREALHDTVKTKTTLATIKTEFDENLKDAMQKDIDGARTPREALSALNNWVETIDLRSGFDYTYRGKEIPRDFSVSMNGDPILLVPRDHHVQSRHEQRRNLSVTYFPNTVFFYNYDNKKFSAHKKKKILQWCQENNASSPYFALVRKRPTVIGRWLSKDQMIDWERVKEVKLPTTARNVSKGDRIPGSYDLYDNGTLHDGVPGNDIDTKKTIFYYTKSAGKPARDMLEKEYGPSVIVKLTINRVAKFKRYFPQARDVVEALNDVYQKWEDSLKPEDVMALRLQNWYLGESLKMLDTTRIDDPEIKKAIKAAKRDISKIEEQRASFSATIGKFYRVKPLENPLNKYPLFSGYTARQNMEHVYVYINAWYQAERKNNV
jgi:hypothetical protein